MKINETDCEVLGLPITSVLKTRDSSLVCARVRDFSELVLRAIYTLDNVRVCDINGGAVINLCEPGVGKAGEGNDRSIGRDLLSCNRSPHRPPTWAPHLASSYLSCKLL
jgi:hypothetical protein